MLLPPEQTFRRPYCICVSQVLNVSMPGPPMQTSLAPLPTNRSSPSPPTIQSVPPRPLILSAPEVPMISSLAAVPSQLPPVHMTTFVRVMAEQAVGLRAFALIALVTSSSRVAGTVFAAATADPRLITIKVIKNKTAICIRVRLVTWASLIVD
jgi:hypothetical protein